MDYDKSKGQKSFRCFYCASCREYCLVFFWQFFVHPLFLSGTLQGADFSLTQQKPYKSSQGYILSQMRYCFESDRNPECYRENAKDFLQKFSIEEIFYIFEQNYQEPEIFSDCHRTGHYLAREEYKTVNDIADVFARCTNTCNGACYHGAVEGFFQDKKLRNPHLTEEDLAVDILRFCDGKDTYAIPRTRGECIHGLGHAMMLATDNDLPTSLSLCDRLEPKRKRDVCYGGAFMQNIESARGFDYPTTIYIKKEDPLYPCNIVDEKYKKACYEYQGAYFLRLSRGDWEETVKLCLEVPNIYQGVCISSIANIQGRDIQLDSQSLVAMRRACEVIQNFSLRGNCIAGTVEFLSGRYKGQASRMLEFCSIVAVENRGVCYSQIGTSISSWDSDPQNRYATCDTILDERYVFLCKSSQTLQF